VVEPDFQLNMLAQLIGGSMETEATIETTKQVAAELAKN